MFRYLVRRLLYAVPILLGVILITFLLDNVMMSPEAKRDIITSASQWVLSNRPTPPIGYSAFAHIWHPNSLDGS